MIVLSYNLRVHRILPGFFAVVSYWIVYVYQLADKVTSIQAQSETTENEEDRKEDNIYEDKNHIELPEKGSMEYTCISSEDSGEYDSETSFVEDENENIEGLKYLVSREKIEEVHINAYMYFI